MSPGRRQAIIWTNNGIVSIELVGTNLSELSEILPKIQAFSFKKMPLKMSSGKRRPPCPSRNVLNQWCYIYRMIFLTFVRSALH